MALKVQAVISAWKTFDLGTLQRELDDTASDLASRQDESEESRKKLVELSREFKKNTPEDVRKQVAPLLKSFQGEIDNLNKRSKYVETAFLNVYKKVIDIADPLPILEYCAGLERKVGRLTDLEIENKNLRETLREYNEEFKEVRNQDVTIKALKEKIKNYEDLMDNNIQSKSKELEKELSKQYTEKERLLHEAQESVVRRLQEAEAKASILQTTLDSTQSELFELKSKSDETNLAKLEETDILINDLERVNQRAVTAERESSQLKEQLQTLTVAYNAQAASTSSVKDVETSADSLARSSLEIELASKDKEIAQLVDGLQQLQSSLNEIRDNTSQKIISLEAVVDNKEQTIDYLQDKIANQKDYDEIKRELSIVKSVEFGFSHSHTREEVSQGSSSPSKPLEILLLEKNKSLQNENTSLKQSNVTLTGKLTEADQELLNLRALVTEQKGLILHLESDLSSVQTLSTLYRGEGEGASMPEIVAEAVKESSISITPPLPPPPLVHSDTRTPTPGGGAPSDFPSAAESLLPIVSSQRERFRQRNEELEAELTTKTQQVVLVQNELDSLRADNLKLYEKIRFLQSYQGRHSREDTAAESRYSSQYEEALDPFSSFSRKEKLRRYSALSPFEKVTLSMGRFILGNKTARTVTFIYTALVHSLIFLVLYKLANTESCKRDFASDCAQRFAEHMHQVHGDDSGNHN
ncbi:hypothetical protein Pcinc_018016 [Petrolisthes cinctipes]|uniref:Protein CASP n=1 Tax=Petrolisthes cinctipes TaxID=88211 RepID=A0AAE1FPH6_PETCI|nr:hypothetical protein Pcinc_018016 [Petrolisthes cinctipes]